MSIETTVTIGSATQENIATLIERANIGNHAFSVRVGKDVWDGNVEDSADFTLVSEDNSKIDSFINLLASWATGTNAKSPMNKDCVLVTQRLVTETLYGPQDWVDSLRKHYPLTIKTRGI
ncbi:hypothetical protein LCGC14_2433590 [marine sediment metagenome]|uniref:Uncharacterized protein n=1 Tax=marine sediment metagenome TaxID=412755 RepID=A0A0F9C8I8_9ZZZZ